MLIAIRRFTASSISLALFVSLLMAIAAPSPSWAGGCDTSDPGCLTGTFTDGAAPAACSSGCPPKTTQVSNPEVNWGVATWTSPPSNRTGRPLPSGLPQDQTTYIIFPERQAYGVNVYPGGYERYRVSTMPYVQYASRLSQTDQPCRLGPTKAFVDPVSGSTRDVYPDGVYWMDSKPWGDYTQNVYFFQDLVIGRNLSGAKPSPEIHDYNAQPFNRKRDITYSAIAIYKSVYWYTEPGYYASYTDPWSGQTNTWWVPPQDIYHDVFDYYEIHQYTIYNPNPTYPAGIKAYTWAYNGAYYRDTKIFGPNKLGVALDGGNCRYPGAKTYKKDCVLAIGYNPSLGLGKATLYGPYGKGLPGGAQIVNNTLQYDPNTQAKTIDVLDSSNRLWGAYTPLGKTLYQYASTAGDPTLAGVSESTMVSQVKNCGKAVMPWATNPQYQGNYTLSAPSKRSVCTWIEYTSSFVGWTATDFYKCSWQPYNKTLTKILTRYCDGTGTISDAADTTTDFYSANCPVTSYTCSTSLGSGYTVTASNPAPSGLANRNMPARATSPDGRKFFNQPLPVLQLLANGKQWKVDWGLPNLTANSGYTNPRSPFQSFILAKDSTPANPSLPANDSTQPIQATINGVRTLTWGPAPGTTGFINPWINTSTTPMMVSALKPGDATSTNEKGVKGFSISMVWGRTYDKRVTVGKIDQIGENAVATSPVTYTEPAILSCEANVFSGKAVTVRNSPAINK